MSDDRCFCGAEWNDPAEECVEGHAFGQEDRLRVENEKLRASLEWALRIIDHELPPQPDPRGDEGEMQSQHYFHEGMREARALLTKGSAR